MEAWRWTRTGVTATAQQGAVAAEQKGVTGMTRSGNGKGRVETGRGTVAESVRGKE
jgi:hypothetical protein